MFYASLYIRRRCLRSHSSLNLVHISLHCRFFTTLSPSSKDPSVLTCVALSETINMLQKVESIQQIPRLPSTPNETGTPRSSHRYLRRRVIYPLQGYTPHTRRPSCVPHLCTILCNQPPVAHQTHWYPRRIGQLLVPRPHPQPRVHQRLPRPTTPSPTTNPHVVLPILVGDFPCRPRSSTPRIWLYWDHTLRCWRFSTTPTGVLLFLCEVKTHLHISQPLF